MTDIEAIDIAIIGAGAAGLMAAISAAQHGAPGQTVLALDGARTLGAKILVAGGGRCNVTHHAVDESAYAGGPGSSRHAIKKVLRAFDVPRTRAFFAELGVELKREQTGKLFPVTDDARTVLNALLRAAREAGVGLHHPWRVESVESRDGGFVIRRDRAAGQEATILARRVILSTGGMALPRTGSDGRGYDMLRNLGHTTTPRIFPALVPLTLDKSRSFITELSGLTLPATITLWSGTGKKLVEFTDSTLCTHFGLSGPSVLDISRYWLDARASDPGATLTINWLPGRTEESLDAELTAARGCGVAAFLAQALPERLGRALCAARGLDPATPPDQLRKDDRRALARALVRTPLPVTGDRGFTHAEVTAGGVPLSELDLATMESRICPGLFVCGEVCDVDGRIGGFNFQWAWASGHLAGRGAALASREPGSVADPSASYPPP
ncbi:MAG: NAD(P)/FAD-dependent oxidoreductase [Phycisphaerales bacterium]|nr:NAD(P)/FAD-dependent oxidoreductase [Phycisphaerales bacterium]